MNHDILGPVSQSFISQRLRLNYVDWGNPDAPPLLLIHGGRDHCRNWDWLASALRDEWHIIAPDLRGHGDSQHSADGCYPLENFVYDLAQLIHQQKLQPVSIIAHSLGGNIAVRYTGLYPEAVRRLIAIEGLGFGPAYEAERTSKPVDVRHRNWIDDIRKFSSRQPKRYPSIEAGFARMIEENKHLTSERARHLTIHGMSQNEDGTYSWKFDNYMRALPPLDMTLEEKHFLWERITCPTLLVYGAQSWASNPEKDGRLSHFQNARVSLYENAGHWVHHDRHDDFLIEARAFLK